MNVLRLMDAKLQAQQRYEKTKQRFMTEFFFPMIKMQMASIYKSMPEEAKKSLSKEQRERIEQIIGG